MGALNTLPCTRPTLALFLRPSSHPPYRGGCHALNKFDFLSSDTQDTDLRARRTCRASRTSTAWREKSSCCARCCTPRPPRPRSGSSQRAEGAEQLGRRLANPSARRWRRGGGHDDEAAATTAGWVDDAGALLPVKLLGADDGDDDVAGEGARLEEARRALLG